MDAGEWGTALKWMMIVLAVDYAGVLFAVVADLWSGVSRCRREGVGLSSRGFRDSVDKAGRYYVCLFAMSVIDCMVLAAVVCVRAFTDWSVVPLPVFSTLGAVAVGCIELKSVVENSHGKSGVKNAERRLRELLKDKDVRGALESVLKMLG